MEIQNHVKYLLKKIHEQFGLETYAPMVNDKITI